MALDSATLLRLETVWWSDILSVPAANRLVAVFWVLNPDLLP